jgi:hypothetical protein
MLPVLLSSAPLGPSALIPEFMPGRMTALARARERSKYDAARRKFQALRRGEQNTERAANLATVALVMPQLSARLLVAVIASPPPRWSRRGSRWSSR